MHQISVNMENFSLWDQISPKIWMIKILKKNHQNTTFQSIWRTFETKFVWANMNDKKKKKKNKQWNGNKHILIYLCTKFLSIWRTSIYEWKEYMNMNGNKFEKVNVKVKISMYYVNLDQISFNLANFWFCGTKLSQRKYEWQKFWKKH